MNVDERRDALHRELADMRDGVTAPNLGALLRVVADLLLPEDYERPEDRDNPARQAAREGLATGAPLNEATINDADRAEFEAWRRERATQQLREPTRSDVATRQMGDVAAVRPSGANVADDAGRWPANRRIESPPSDADRARLGGGEVTQGPTPAPDPQAHDPRPGEQAPAPFDRAATNRPDTETPRLP